MRRFILRENISEVDIAKWINAMNEVAESTRLGIPVLIASNSRNENAERTFGMNDAVGVFYLAWNFRLSCSCLRRHKEWWGRTNNLRLCSIRQKGMGCVGDSKGLYVHA